MEGNLIPRIVINVLVDCNWLVVWDTVGVNYHKQGINSGQGLKIQRPWVLKTWVYLWFCLVIKRVILTLFNVLLTVHLPFTYPPAIQDSLQFCNINSWWRKQSPFLTQVRHSSGILSRPVLGTVERWSKSNSPNWFSFTERNLTAMLFSRRFSYRW